MDPVSRVDRWRQESVRTRKLFLLDLRRCVRFAVHGISSLCLLWVAGASIFPNPAGCAEQAVTLQPRERWTNEFGGGLVVRSFQVTASREFAGNLLWSLSTMHRTLARGEKLVQASGNAAANVEVRIVVDALKDEVIMPAQFDVTLADANGPVARHVSTIYFFAREPFAARRAWLSSFPIMVFDPLGKTADVLRTAQIPYTETRNRTVLSSLQQGVLLIGEGVTFSDFPGLSDQIMRSALQGTWVICLAPAAGSFSLELSPSVSPAKLLFQDATVIHRLDKKLDAAAWAPTGSLGGIRVRFAAAGGAITAQLGNEGWPWMESHFADTNGRFVLCGLPVIERWEESPTPRYLLLRILEDLKKE